MRRSALLALAGVLLTGAAFAQTSDDYTSLTTRFDAQINPHELDGWMKLLAAEPNQVGSPHDKSNAEWIRKQFQDFGWAAHIETYRVLYPTPISETLEMPNLNGKPWKATLQERPIPGDSSYRTKDYTFPAYVAFQG